jgi:sugar phosphate isomerase/epimerase
MRTRTEITGQEPGDSGETVVVAVSTGCLYDLDIPTEKAVVELAGMGVTDVEIYLQGPPEMGQDYVSELAAVCRGIGVTVGSVHPYGFGLENLLYTSYSRQRAWALGQYERYLQICEELEARYYVAHGPPWHHVMREGRLTPEYRSVTTQLANLARGHGVIYCIENVSYGLIREPGDAVRHRTELAVDVPFVLDVKSAWKAGFAPQDFANALAGDIAFTQVSFRDRANGAFGLCAPGETADPDLTATVVALSKARRGRTGRAAGTEDGSSGGHAEGPGPVRLVVEVFNARDVTDLQRTVAAVRSLTNPADAADHRVATGPTHPGDPSPWPYA